MRILTIVNNLGPGGAQGSAKNVSLAYIEQGQTVAVLGYQGGGVREEPLRAAGAEIFVGSEDPDEQLRVIKEAAAWNPDIIHLRRSGHADQSVTNILRTIKAASTKRIAVIESNIFGRVDRTTDRELYNVHLMIGGWCLWKWHQWARGLKPQPIGAVAHNIVRSDAFYPVGDDARRAFRDAHKIPQDAMLFGRIGQPMRTKWSHAAFEAFKTFATEREDAWFVAVGLPRNYSKYLATFPSDVRRRIVVIEFLHGEEALRDCYAGMDVFLHSSRIGESFGNVLAEAMLCNRPVITLSTPARDNSQLEVVGHERGGLCVANVKAMVEAMRRLADDPQLRDRYGKQGRAYCLEHYSSQAIGRILLRVAELAHQHEDHETLARAIEADPVIVSRVTTEEVNARLKRMIGKTSAMDRLMMWLIHAPVFYRLWSVMRKIHRAVRGPGDKQRLMREKSAIASGA